MKGLDVTNKSDRVYHFHKRTVEAFTELLAAAGLKNASDLKREHVYRRISMSEVSRYDQLYPEIPVGCLIGTDTIPELFRKEMLGAIDK